MWKITAFVLLLVRCAEGCPSGGRASAPAISVLLFDYAGLSAETLRLGLIEANRILASGGVQMVWIHCPVDPDRLALDKTCRAPAGPLTLVLHILPPGATRRNADPGACGFVVIPNDRGFGTYAGVFHERIKKLHAYLSESVALGHVIAHELGHLLMGTGHHSVAGIMKADWNTTQIAFAGQGLLRFHPNEQKRILDNVRRRKVAAEAGLQEELLANDA